MPVPWHPTALTPPPNPLRSLFVPVVNLEKIPSIPKPDGHGIKVPPKAIPNGSKESLGKPGSAAVPKEPPVPVGLRGDSSVPDDGPGGKPENGSAPGEKPPSHPSGATKTPPRSHKKLARESPPLSMPVMGGDAAGRCPGPGGTSQSPLFQRWGWYQWGISHPVLCSAAGSGGHKREPGLNPPHCVPPRCCG